MSRISKVFLIIVMIASLVIGVTGCGNNEEALVNDNEKIKELKIANSDDNWMHLNVYFDGSKNNKEVNVIKEERLLKLEELMGKVIIQELIKGPSVESKLKPILHKDTKLLSFSIKDGTAYINLSPEAKYDMSAAREEACLRSIVLSLTQLESINKVKILIDNASVETLGGNFNISKAFGITDIENIKKK